MAKPLIQVTVVFRRIILALGLLTLLVQTHVGYAQSPVVQILCDTTFNKFETARPLPGTVYRVTAPVDGQATYQLKQITPTETQILDIPIPNELYGKINPYRPKISPDGQYLAFEPFDTGTAILIWKVGTSEAVVLLLSPDDAKYLIDTGTPLRLREKHLMWTDNTHLLIQYFDIEHDFNHLLAQKILTISEPLQIEEGIRIDIKYPDLTPPTPSTFPRAGFSPQNTYVTLLTEWIYNRIQVYDTRSGQLLVDLQSDDTKGIISSATWTFDESRFFIMYQLHPNTSPVQLNMVEIDVNKGFQINDNLRMALEAEFGSDITFQSNFSPILNPSGTKLAAQIYVPNQQKYYLIVEQLNTGNIKAICDDGRISSTSFPIWGTDEDYIAYFDGGWMIAYDLNIGKGYGDDGRGFAGWLASPAKVATATPTG